MKPKDLELLGLRTRCIFNILVSFQKFGQEKTDTKDRIRSHIERKERKERRHLLSFARRAETHQKF